MKVIPPLEISSSGSFSRATTKTCIGPDGQRQTVPVDVLALQYDLANLSAAPVALLEGAATNSVRNNTMAGAVAGTPGTLPTNWTKGGLTVNVVGSDVQNGIEYIDLQCTSASAVSGAQVAFDSDTAIAGATGQEWTGSFFANLIAGSLAGVTTYVNIQERTAAGAFLIETNTAFAPPSGAMGSYRATVTRTLDQASTGRVIATFKLTSTGAFDFTVRIGLPQLELGSVATSPIKTSGAAVTRAADIITGTGLCYSSAVETAPAAYVSGTTYARDATVSVAGTLGALDCYTSLQAANLGHAPASSPTWWAFSGTTYAPYGSGTYAKYYRVIDPIAHNTYESLIDGNTGNALTDETKWFLVGKTNRWAQFDVLRNTATVAASPLVTVLKPGVRVNAIMLAGLVATSVTITMTVGGTTVYTYTQDLNTRVVADSYDYCFKPFGTRPALALFNLPPYSTAAITITLTNTAGLVKCGDCLIGSAVYIGDIQYEAESDALNFSTVTRDKQGSATLEPERNVPKVIGQIFLPKALVDSAYDLRDALNGSVAAWVGIDDGTDGYFKSLLIKGFYRRMTINMKYPEHAIISLEIEEI